MSDNCINCFKKGTNGKSLWGCQKCNFLNCAKCSVVVDGNARICFQCKSAENQPVVSQPDMYADLPEAFLKRIMPQPTITPSIVDRHLLPNTSKAYGGTSDKSPNDKAAIAAIEERLRKLKGMSLPSSSGQQKCGMCGTTAVYKCPECLHLSNSGVQDLYCKRCLAITHVDNERFKNHNPVEIC